MMRTTTALFAALMLTTFAHADEKKAPSDWKELFDGKTLDGWKQVFGEFGGKCHVKDGAIVMERGKNMSGVVYTKKDFPKSNYEVTLEGKRIDGRDFFATTTFPVGDSHCSLVTGGWGGSVVGLSSINGSDASENETSGSKEFKAGEWYKIRIRVTDAKVEAWIGDDQVADVTRKGRKINTRIECEECHPFGFCTYDTVGAVRNIRVRSLTEKDKK